MAEKVGVSRDTWRRYEKGDVPTGETLLRLSELGFSVDWLLTGTGPMRPGDDEPAHRPMATPSPTDPELLGFLFDGLGAVYRDAGSRIAPVEQGRLVAELYDAAVSAGDDPAERRAAARALLTRVRQDLLRSQADPTSTKRQA